MTKNNLVKILWLKIRAVNMSVRCYKKLAEKYNIQGEDLAHHHKTLRGCRYEKAKLRKELKSIERL